MRSTLRAVLVVVAFIGLTLPLMPVQALLCRWSRARARAFPHWYHRQVCSVLGLRLTTRGRVCADRPVLIVANHVSWLDIPLLSAVAPVSFVSKKEVAGWPFVATLARLQRTVFVDRERRTRVGETASEILGRLAGGDTIVLFAEGTSSDGNRVLPFKTSLFAAVKPSVGTGSPSAPPTAVVQAVSIAYTRQGGLPLGWAGRRALGYYGDVGMAANAWAILTGGPIEAVVTIGEPVALTAFPDRKALALRSERAVRTGLVSALRG